MKTLTYLFILFGVHFGVFSQKHFQIAKPFDEQNSPPTPDYSFQKNWAAHPHHKDLADSIPENKIGLFDNQKDAKADVFFIYPTLYTQVPKNLYLWNASTDDTELNHRIDQSTIRHQASLFNGSCRVYAPRYRQAHYSVFTTTNKEASQKALNLAYEDVKIAFEHYLKTWNQGRPIVIAGHSQGTVHAKRLLKEFFDEKPLYKQLVTAYLVGIATAADSYKEIPPSILPTEVGGFVSWNTFLKNYYPPYYENGLNTAFLINPLTWTTSTAWVSRNENHGGVGPKYNIIDQPANAKIQNGILWINKPYVKGRVFLNKKIWHAADYNLFWLNTRENVALRIEQYLIKNKP
jgi:Protein of unknown function (DUF3089)